MIWRFIAGEFELYQRNSLMRKKEIYQSRPHEEEVRELEREGEVAVFQ